MKLLKSLRDNLPDDGWKKGQYLLKIFFESPGQELYEGNVVGTMIFTITDGPIS